MLLLAIDTATAAVCVALRERTGVLAQDCREEPAGGLPRHGELLAPAIEQVLADARLEVPDLTHIVCGVGPGPFTGLRVGVVTALVLARARDLPVMGVCSLDGVADDALRAGAPELARGFVVVTDARRREVYVARYDGVGARTWGPRVMTPAEAARSVAGTPVVGPGAHQYQDVFRDAGSPVLGPPAVSATGIAAVAAARVAAGDQVPPPGAVVLGDPDADGSGTTVPTGLLPAEPLYLRRPDAVPGAGVVPVPS